MEYTDEFQEFWKKYPARWNPHNSTSVKRKKRPAFDKWQKLSPEIHRECLFKVKYIKAHEGSASSVRDCVTWLNQCGWEDIDLEVPQAFMPKEFDTANILKMVPQEDKRSISDKVNEQKNALGVSNGNYRDKSKMYRM